MSTTPQTAPIEHLDHTDPVDHIDQIDQVAERVERLLLRYEELLLTNAILSEEIETLTTDRDLLKAKLSAARMRVETLLDRLPELTTGTPL